MLTVLVSEGVAWAWACVAWNRARVGYFLVALYGIFIAVSLYIEIAQVSFKLPNP
jgi:hypothetical protein